MIKCIAIDDEPLALQLLVDNISKIPFLQLVASCDSAIEANQVLQEKEVDLIFIDIQMPGITGLQFIKSLVKKPMVIMVTAYKQYALDGFALDVIDYLVKPEVHLESTSKTAIVRMSMKNMEETLPANFKRIHKSFIVNLDKVTSIKKNALLIVEQELPVSDSYKGIIDELLNNK